MVHFGSVYSGGPTGGSDGDAETGPMKEDPPGSGLYVPDTSELED